MKCIYKILSLSIFYLFVQTAYCYSQLVSDFKVNDDTTPYPHLAPKVGADSAGNFVVVWQDERNSNSDSTNVNVFCQRYLSNATPIGINFRINENLNLSASPNIIVRANRSFIVCWKEFYLLPLLNIKIFDSNGSPISSVIKINDSLGGISLPSMGTDLQNNFVIVWENYVQFLGERIFCQRMDAFGNKIGINQNVSDVGINSRKSYPDITVRRDGSYIICWQDNRLNSEFYDIYMQMYNSNGERIGSNTLVNEDTFMTQEAPKITSDSACNFCITWNDQRFFASAFCQFYNYNGQKLGNNILVSGSEVPTVISSKPNGDLAIGMGRGLPSNMQRIKSDRTFLGNSFSISNQALSSWKIQTGLTIRNDRIINAWQDNRNGQFDIYCNVLSYQNPDSLVSIINLSNKVPDQFKLLQNYPNPFNSSTEIRFDIISSNNYNLDLYNNLGQKVKTIFNKYLSTGSYKINVEFISLNSGIYFYSLSSPKEKSIKKLLLIK